MHISYSMKMPLLLAILVGSLLAWPSALSAALRVQVSAVGLTAAELQATRQLLDAAQAVLPESFRQRLDRQVEIVWHDLPPKVFGRADGDGARIELNRDLLSGLVSGRLRQLQTGRSHGTAYRELLATLLHELMHVYDRAGLWSEPVARTLMRCRMLSGPPAAALPQHCRLRGQRQFSLSDDPLFLDLAGWPARIGTRGRREADNRMLLRSPDAYELQDPQEYLAVNFEYFLLDPEYACRRPSLARYLARHFDADPAAGAGCPEALPFLNAGDLSSDPLLLLDPRRVYAVHYLLAEPNRNWASRWGHSMLRLVVCAPEHLPGPQCLLDLEHHLVLSFRAFVQDVQLSTWSGLSGEYPSRLFILPLSQVVDEYTKMELRGLSSVPLNLQADEIRSLLERSAEMHWAYDGEYYFMSNNCAVETSRLLAAGSQSQAMQGLDSIMPNDLLALMVARGLADPVPLRDPAEALRQGYRFASYRDYYQRMFDLLELPVEDVEHWFALPAVERRQRLEAAGTDTRRVAALLLLEQGARLQVLLRVRDDLKQRYLGPERESEPGFRKTGQVIQELLVQAGFLSRPAELLNESGFGIPLLAEVERARTQARLRQKRLLDLGDGLQTQVRALVSPGLLHELEGIQLNLDQLRKTIRQLVQP